MFQQSVQQQLALHPQMPRWRSPLHPPLPIALPQERLSRALVRAASDGGPFDWVCLLGGTNDAICGADAAEVLEALDKMHAEISSSGARLVAMTLPPFLAPLGDAERRAFYEINSGLRQRFLPSAPLRGTVAGAGAALGAAGADSGGEREEAAVSGVLQPPEGRLLVDLEALLSPAALGPAEAARLWDDEVHLTPDGYGFVGDRIFEALLPHLGLR
jgi:lysophospholipase L1-like esterase